MESDFIGLLFPFFKKFHEIFYVKFVLSFDRKKTVSLLYSLFVNVSISEIWNKLSFLQTIVTIIGLVFR